MNKMNNTLKHIRNSKFTRIYLITFIINSLILLYSLISIHEDVGFSIIFGLIGLFVITFEIINLTFLFISIKNKYPIQFTILPLSEILITFILPMFINDRFVLSILNIFRTIWATLILFNILQKPKRREALK